MSNNKESNWFTWVSSVHTVPSVGVPFQDIHMKSIHDLQRGFNEC